MRMDRKCIAVTLALSIAAGVFVTSCSVDTDRLSDGINNLNDAVNDYVGNTETTISSEESTEPVIVPDSTEIIESTEDRAEMTEPTETTPEPTATPTPEPTATPTPTPLPERVDFSELVTEPACGDVTINVEDFSEHYEENEVTLASFCGNRMTVEIPDEEYRTYAVNQILDGFYQEVYGEYNKAVDEALAEYADSEEMPFPVTVEVTYSYISNDRILSVIMKASKYDENEVYEEFFEIATFDMYTGQFITVNNICDDTDALLEALLEMSTLEEMPEAKDVINFWILAPQQGASALTSEIYIETEDGIISFVADINQVSGLMNRYGRTVYL